MASIRHAGKQLQNTILITGSSGTIGTRLAERLLKLGYDIIGIDKKMNTWVSHVNRVTRKVNLLNYDALVKLVSGKLIYLVIHLGANARVHNLVVAPELAKDNVISTINILEFCRRKNIKNFIFTSSREVYGNGVRTAKREGDILVDDTDNPYAASKIAGEAFVRAYAQCYDMRFVILRFSNVFGMYDKSDRIIPRYISQALRNEKMIVYGGKKILDFTYIDDTVDGILLAIQKLSVCHGRAYNISSGHGLRLKDVATTIKKMTGSTSKLSIEKNRTGEIMHYIADIKLAKQVLQYAPRYSWEEAIRKTIAWYHDHPVDKIIR